MKFVVIGGDAAGMSAASRAKRNDAGLDVVVLEQTTDVSYSACGMPYNVADAARVMDDLVVRHANGLQGKARHRCSLGAPGRTHRPARPEGPGAHFRRRGL